MNLFGGINSGCLLFMKGGECKVACFFFLVSTFTLTIFCFWMNIRFNTIIRK